MPTVRTSAPGKLVLIGEYAVLHGAQALVMAVDRRARVEVRACRPEESRVEVPELGLEPVRFRLDDGGGVSWLDAAAGQPEFAFCRSLIEQRLGRGITDYPAPGGVAVSVDTAELYGRREGRAVKLGLGSSAAVSVALRAALDAYVDGEDAVPGMAEMLSAHQFGQGGRGSGIDVAASLSGGVMVYRLGGSGPEQEPMPWCGRIPLLFIWTGRPAATAEFLQRYAAWRAAEPASARSLQCELSGCATHAVAAVRTFDMPELMTCVNNYRNLMGKIGSLIGAPVIGAEHARLAALADDLDVAYKPCGAGGGDVGMMVASSPEALTAARERVQADGYQALDLAPSSTGLELRLHDPEPGPGY